MRPSLGAGIEVDVGERKDFDDRYSHVGGDGMIFDNRNEMEVVTKICQKSCKSYIPVCQPHGFNLMD